MVVRTYNSMRRRDTLFVPPCPLQSIRLCDVTQPVQQLPEPATLPWRKITEIWLIRVAVALAAILELEYCSRSALKRLNYYYFTFTSSPNGIHFPPISLTPLPTLITRMSVPYLLRMAKLNITKQSAVHKNAVQCVDLLQNIGKRCSKSAECGSPSLCSSCS